ncbi:Urea transporter [Bacillus freudenreichii]|nr:Urea transporter [Bacillus freudenreichii]
MQKTTGRPQLKENLKFFLTASMRGISQVLLIDNAVTGFFILLIITSTSIFLGIITLLSTFIGTLIGIVGGADKESVTQGLFGFNSVLTGIALALFMNGPYHWIIALFGAAIAAILVAAMMHAMKPLGIPILSAPFILITWFTLLVSYRLKAFTLTSELVPQDLARWKLDTTGKVDWTEGAFYGIGQIFFLHETIAGVLLFLAVFWAGWRLGIFAIMGNLTALLASYWLGGEHTLIFMGLYGYNGILAILAVAIIFNDNKGWIQPLLSGILAAFLTVPLTASITTLLLPYGLPALTMPFILSTWIILGARKVLPKL